MKTRNHLYFEVTTEMYEITGQAFRQTSRNGCECVGGRTQKYCQLQLNMQVPAFKIDPLSSSPVHVPCHFTLLCCGWRQQRHSHMTAGCLARQRWGRMAGPVALLLSASTSLDDKTVTVGKHTERDKSLKVGAASCSITDEPKIHPFNPFT